MKNVLYFFLFISTTSIFLQAETFRYRAIINDHPETTITIGFDQKYFYTLPNNALTFGPKATVYYDTVDHGTDISKYKYSKITERRVWAKSMLNCFATLVGLTPNTKYYFVIEDADGLSERFSFKTFPDDNRKLFFVAGGDTRSNQDVRRRGNELVSKLKPDAVLFGGDMTFYDDIIGEILPFEDYLSLPYTVILDIIIKNPITDFFVKLVTDEELPPYFHEWKVWFDDWQLTTTHDNRLIPIIPTRGNHELFNESISELFNTKEEVYYATTFGQNLLRVYTLNSEISVLGDQKDWLENDLAENSPKVIWTIAQYHTTIKPHHSEKEIYPELLEFAKVFTRFSLDLAVECDTHVVKTTYPISVSDSPDADDNFITDQENGTVYVGEGTWGAPLREDDRNWMWTKNTGSFNQFNLIFVDNQRLEVRKLDFDQNDPNNLSIPDDERKFSEILKQANFWNPDNDGTVIMENKYKPTVWFEKSIKSNYSPADVKNNPLVFRVQANAVVIPNHYTKQNKIKKVKFFVNNQFHSTDEFAPFEMTFKDKQEGLYNIKAVAYDEFYYSNVDGVMGEATKTITIGDFSAETKVLVASPQDDAVEVNNGIVNIRRDVLPFNYRRDTRKVGIKFKSVTIPENAYINDAYVVFTSKTSSSASNTFKINIENSAKSKDYFRSKHNISNRQVLEGAEVNWNLNSNSKEVRTPNLSCLISSFIKTDNWIDNGDINLFFEETSKKNEHTREFYSANSSIGKPYLVIKYTIKTDWEEEISPKVSFRSEKYNYSYRPENYSSTIPLVLNVNAEADRSREFNEGNYITKVDFYVNNEFYSSDISWPYTIKFKNTTPGLYVVEAIATDLYGFTAKTTRLITFGNFSKEIQVPLYNPTNYSFENSVGVTQLGNEENYLLEESDFYLMGLRFEKIDLPSYATIDYVYIDFGTSQSNPITNTNVSVESKADALDFSQDCGNLSSRDWFSDAVIWDESNDASSIKSPNLQSLVSEIVTQPEWTDYSGINFVLETQSASVFSSLLQNKSEESSDNTPKLVIKYSVKTQSAELVSNERVSVYPSLLDRSNPTLNILPNDGLKYVRLLIYNQSSEIAFDKELKSSEKQSVDLGALPSGIYFLQAVGQNGEIYKRTKIIKQ